jgi:predicted DNA-binding WGR domain protein
MKRELTFRDLRSNKFWTAESSGNDVIVRWGRIGTAGRSLTKSFATLAGALAAVEKLVAGKLKEGYVEGPVAELPPRAAIDWASRTMSEDVFWDLLSLFDWKKTGDDDAVLAPAVRALAAMTEADIARFGDLLAEKLHALDTREHARFGYLGAIDPDDGDVYLSPDDFLYLRCVVVANGRAVFDQVLADPKQMPRDLEFEALLSVASAAFERKTHGRELEHSSPVSYESFSNTAGWAPTAATRPGKMTGERMPPGNRRPT